LDSPEENEDTHVIEVLAEEHLADLLANTRSHQSAVAVYHRVYGNDDVDGEDHCHHEVSLVLDLSRGCQLIIGIVKLIDAAVFGI
jgi:hypothetical protein